MHTRTQAVCCPTPYCSAGFCLNLSVCMCVLCGVGALSLSLSSVVPSESLQIRYFTRRSRGKIKPILYDKVVAGEQVTKWDLCRYPKISERLYLSIAIVRCDMPILLNFAARQTPLLPFYSTVHDRGESKHQWADRNDSRYILFQKVLRTADTIQYIVLNIHQTLLHGYLI